MTNIVRLLVVLLVLAGLGFGGVFYLAQTAEAPVHPVEKVLPDDQFPR